MPTRRDGRVEPGQPIRTAFSASAWNRAQDAADVVLGQRPGFGAELLQPGKLPYIALPCRNATGQDVPRWGVLQVALSASNLPTAEDSSQFESVPVLAGIRPDGINDFNDEILFGIAVEPIRNNGHGMVAIDGIVQCKLEVVNTSDLTAGPKDSVTELQSGGFGATILWKESGAGVDKWALIRLGLTRTIRMGRINQTWQKNTNRVVTAIDGNGLDVPSPRTFLARNHFADVTVLSGTRRVACALVDSTWVLIAAEC